MKIEYAGKTPILLHHIPSPTISVRIICGSGSLEESKPGVAHYLEHLFFKATQTLSSNQINRKLASLGDGNAYTDFDKTVFYIETIPSQYEEALDLLFDLILNPKISVEDVELERGPIIEEWRGGQDQAWSCLYDTLGREMFGVNPVIGFEDTIKSITRQDLIEFRDSNYTSENLCIALVGDLSGINMQKVKQRVEGAWPQSSISRKQPSQPCFEGGRVDVKHNSDQAIVLLALPRKSQNVAFDLACNVLGGDVHSLLYNRIREELGLGYAVGSYPWEIRGASMTLAYAMVNPKQTEQTYEEMLKVIQSAKVCDSLLETSKKNLLFALAKQSQTPSGYAHAWVDSWFEEEDASYEEYEEKVQRCNTVGVQEALDYLAHAHRLFVVNGD